MRNYLFSSFISLAIIGSCNSPQGTGNRAADHSADTPVAGQQATEQVQQSPDFSAPELRLPDKDGNPVALSSLKGNIIMVDFWASWCKPCRAENPRIVAMYNRLKDSTLRNGGKFHIYSVSLDDNKLAWFQAIEKDKLTWPHHVSDLRGWNSVAASIYRIEAIPTNLLIDTTGAIVARDLSVPEIEYFVKERIQ